MRTADRTDTPSLAATYTSAAFGLDHLEGYSITFAATETVASMVGAVKLQASNDAFDGNTSNQEKSGATWVDITGSSQAISGTGNVMWNTSAAYYRAVRYVYTRTSGTGTAAVYLHAKGSQS